ncbi:hypothetical protein DENSPDRAFT_659641 [Dentipellis sp. KUC8613]|nr:hypothetical protein DENSPDRAFT_659641 [Dentipellis sp. KUC8613]
MCIYVQNQQCDRRCPHSNLQHQKQQNYATSKIQNSKSRLQCVHQRASNIINATFLSRQVHIAAPPQHNPLFNRNIQMNSWTHRMIPSLCQGPSYRARGRNIPYVNLGPPSIHPPIHTRSACLAFAFRFFFSFLSFRLDIHPVLCCLVLSCHVVSCRGSCVS